MSLDTEVIAQARFANLAHSLQRIGDLPEWLVAPMQPQPLVAALERHVPEFASGDLAIRRCKPDRLRLKGQVWEALYVLTVDGPDQQVGREIKLAGTCTPPDVERVPVASDGPFGSPTWRVYVPELRLDLWMSFEDEALETLPVLMDAEQARALLEQSIRACSPAYAEMRLKSARPRVARYKPGTRATIVYDLEYMVESGVGSAWPDMVIAKTYSKDKGRNAYEAMSKLWASPLSKGDVVAIAEPLAYIPEHKVLIQGPVRGDGDLKDLLKEALRANRSETLVELYDITRKTAAGLAALHQSGARHGETITWEVELDEIRGEVEKLSAVFPWFADVANPLLAQLAALAEERAADPTLPAHRSFRPQQVLVHDGNVGFIDFDGFCLAEPALDIALFRATIKEMGINTSPSDKQKEFMYPSEEARLERMAQLDAICEAFLVEYERFAPVSRQRVALWEALDLLTVVLRCWTKVKPHQLDNAMALLQAHLHSAGWTDVR
ncbi:MAG TPA: phosphotransferase [Roseiflexaceae bacterium]|nr:phosphotransferase [Roseiflexaceae bacterium]